MKATGIIRRVDDLGRVVIPKEIRRQCHIKEGEPLEIYVDKLGEMPVVCFAKYERTFSTALADIKTNIAELMDNVGEYEDAAEFRKAMTEAEKIFKRFEAKED